MSFAKYSGTRSRSWRALMFVCPAGSEYVAAAMYEYTTFTGYG